MLNYIFIKECLRVKEAAIIAASEIAELILRVDDIIKCAPRRRERPWSLSYYFLLN